MTAKRTKQQNRDLYFYLNRLSWQLYKADLVSSYTGGRTEHSSQMTFQECKSLIDYLKRMYNDKRQKQRNTVIHYLALLGYTDYNGHPDYARIDGFIQRIGNRNPRRKILNYLDYEELNKVVSQVKAMYNKELINSSR